MHFPVSSPTSGIIFYNVENLISQYALINISVSTEGAKMYAY